MKFLLFLNTNTLKTVFASAPKNVTKFNLRYNYSQLKLSNFDENGTTVSITYNFLQNNSAIAARKRSCCDRTVFAIDQFLIHQSSKFQYTIGQVPN